MAERKPQKARSPRRAHPGSGFRTRVARKPPGQRKRGTVIADAFSTGVASDRGEVTKTERKVDMAALLVLKRRLAGT